MGIAMNGREAVLKPATVVDNFITATIEEDVNAMGRLLGLNSENGTPMSQVFGKLLGDQLQQYWQGQAQQLTDYRWNTLETDTTDNGVNIQVDLYRPNYSAIAHRTDELLGFTTDAAGMLVAPEEPKMDVDEAERRAREDPNIKPFHYRLSVRTVQQDGRWILDPQDPKTVALVGVIRRGDLLDANETYLVR
ncbi:hypothetical protein [Deinococcus radiotolerans]|nr:hypothetical protein [Deinococcus radiotolerans]